MRDRIRRMIESTLPWYDPHLEEGRAARSDDIHYRSIAARLSAESLTPIDRERIARAYRAYAAAMRR